MRQIAGEAFQLRTHDQVVDYLRGSLRKELA